MIKKVINKKTGLEVQGESCISRATLSGSKVKQKFLIIFHYKHLFNFSFEYGNTVNLTIYIGLGINFI